MSRKRRDIEKDYQNSYNDITQPIPRVMTTPIQTTGFMLRESWPHRFARSLSDFFRAVVHKFNRLLGLAYAVLVLLLLARMALIAFNLTASIFSQWVLLISAPIMFPFNNLIPVFFYAGYRIDASILVAIFVYGVAVKLVSLILKILVD